jgi:hypothetical protein
MYMESECLKRSETERDTTLSEGSYFVEGAWQPEVRHQSHGCGTVGLPALA